MSTMSREIVVVDDEQQLAARGAAHIADCMRAAVAGQGVFRIASAGGSTPRLVNGVLANDPSYRDLPWDRVDIFWGDERTVPSDHADSNYRMAVETLLSKVPVDASRIHRIPSELPDHDAAARQYEQTLRAVFGVRESLPRFDLILLGMGADGHTASLFPGSTAVAERARLVVASYAEAMKAWRITLTLPVLNAAAQVTVMVNGASKAAAAAAALEPPQGATPPPAGLVQPVNGCVTWMLDRAAAKLLTSAT